MRCFCLSRGARLSVPLLFWGTLVAAADIVSIEVFPPQARLDSSRDRQRLIVQALHADGRTEDVTAAATVTATNPALAAIDRPAGRIVLRPQADGETAIRV